MNKILGKGVTHTQSLNIALLDNCAISRLGLEALLTELPLVTRVSSRTSNLDILKDALTQGDVQIVIMELLNSDGQLFQLIDFIHQVKARHPEIKLVIYTRVTDKRILSFFYNIGVSAIISRRDTLIETLDVLVRMLNEGNAYSQSISRLLFQGKPISAQRSVSLTISELRVLKYLLVGLTLRQIGNLTKRSVKTLSCQKRSVMRKFGVSTDGELIAFLQMAAGQGEPQTKMHTCYREEAQEPLYPWLLDAQQYPESPAKIASWQRALV